MKIADFNPGVLPNSLDQELDHFTVSAGGKKGFGMKYPACTLVSKAKVNRAGFDVF